MRGVAVALDLVLDPHEHLGIDRLRAGVAAEQSAGDRGDEEQRVGGDNEQGGQVDHVLRPEHGAENVELALDEVEQDGLPAVPFQPQTTVEDDLGEKNEGDTPVVEKAANPLGVDFLALFVERNFRDGFCLRIRFGMSHRFSVGGFFNRVGNRDGWRRSNLVA